MFELRRSHILQALLLIAAVWLVIILIDVVVLLFITFLLTVVLQPTVAWLRKHHVPAAVASIGTVVATLAALVGLGYLIIPPLASQLAQFVDKLPSYIAQIQKSLPINPEIDIKSIEAFVSQYIQAISNALFAITTTLIAALVAVVTTIVVVLYWLTDYERIKSTLLNYTPKKQRPRANDIWSRTEKKLTAWLRGQLLLGLVVGVMVWLGALIIGLPFPLVLGIIAALLEIIPTIGPILAAVPGVLLGLTISVQTALFALIMYVAVQQIENHFVGPYLLGKTIQLHPIVIIFSLLIGAALYGIIGLLIAVPVALTIKAVMDSFYEQPKLRPRQSS